MNRRELLLGAAAMAAAATAGSALAAEHNHDHDHMSMAHDHHAMSSRNDKLIAAAADCALKANICVQHCIVLMGQGEQDMAACAQTSSQAAALCTALQQMASADSKHLPQLAKVVMDVCKECEEECRKTERHPECKACKEACVACYKECEAIAA